MKIRSFAKINLTLDILSRRADAYHELASIVHPIGLWDEISLELTSDDAIVFSCNRADLAGDGNLCVRAVRAFRGATQYDFGARIHLEKRIPTGAGLGGGSGNAAAVLKGLNIHFQGEIRLAQLNEMAAQLGADVPLFLRGGAVLMEGIGEKLTPLSSLEGWVVIIKPEVSLSTPAIYRAWDKNGFQSKNRTPKMRELWQNRDVREIAACLGNDLERAAQKVGFDADFYAEKLRENGALGAQMTGSGSAVFGVFKSQTAAQNAADMLDEKSVFVAPFCEHGIKF